MKKMSIDSVTRYSRSTMPTTAQVDAHGVDAGKDGKGATFDQSFLNKAESGIMTGGTPSGKKGTGGTDQMSNISKKAKSGGVYIDAAK